MTDAPIKIPCDRAKALLADIDSGRLTVPPHMRAITELMLCGGMDLMIVAQCDDPFRAIRPNTITLIGDDLDESRGPTAFHAPSLRRALRSAAGVAIVSAAPDERVYAQAAVSATQGKPVVLIETRMRHEIEWIKTVEKYAKKAATLVVTEKQVAQ